MENGAACYSRFLEGDKEAVVEIVTEYNNGLVLFLTGLAGVYELHRREVGGDCHGQLLAAVVTVLVNLSQTKVIATIDYKVAKLIRDAEGIAKIFRQRCQSVWPTLQYRRYCKLI